MIIKLLSFFLIYFKRKEKTMETFIYETEEGDVQVFFGTAAELLLSEDDDFTRVSGLLEED